MSRHQAILLLGPTGSGKSPLGDHLETHGLWNRRCYHFDFGRELRRALAGAAPPPPQWTKADADFVRAMLEQGALLEKERFYIAERILESFLTRNNPNAGDRLVLNGWPRHIEQAQSVARSATVGLVVQLHCSDRDVQARIARDTGGDRCGRDDDAPAIVAHKLALYRKRTEPLLDHYRQNGVEIVVLQSAWNTTPSAAARHLASTPDPWQAMEERKEQKRDGLAS